MNGLEGFDTLMRKHPVWPMEQTIPREFLPGQGGEASIFQGPVSTLDPLGGIFGGERAITRSPGMLKEARRLMKLLKGTAKKVSEKVRKKTGWFKGLDDKWRFEIDDSKMILKTNLEKSQTKPLGELIEHDELFKAYPELKNMNVEINVPAIPKSMMGEVTEGRGSFRISDFVTGKPTIEVSGTTPKQTAETLIHEIQHVVQETEGFAKGGSPEGQKGYIQELFKDVKNLRENANIFKEHHIDEINAYEDQYRATNEEIIKLASHGDLEGAQALQEAQRNTKSPAWNKWFEMQKEYLEKESEFNRVAGDPEFSFKRYQSLAGEIESRDAASRMDFGPLQRTGTRPDIDRPEAIVQYGLRGEAGQVGPVKTLNQNLRGRFKK